MTDLESTSLVEAKQPSHPTGMGVRMGMGGGGGRREMFLVHVLEKGHASWMLAENLRAHLTSCSLYPVAREGETSLSINVQCRQQVI